MPMPLHHDQQVLRPLPRQTRPFRHEVVLSFLGRLEQRNGLPKDYLRDVLKESSGDIGANLATLTGLDEVALSRLFPELRPGSPEAPLNGSNKMLLTGRRRLNVRPACRRCAVRRTNEPDVMVWCEPEDVICRRHCRWIGQGDQQIELDLVPEVVAANRLHRRLVRLNGSDQVKSIYPDAANIIDFWHRRGVLPAVAARLQRLLGDNAGFPTTSAPHLHIAQYSEIVRLVALLSDTSWIIRAFDNPTNWEQALDDVVQSVTGGYRPEGMHDALMRWKHDRKEEFRSWLSWSS
jgi:hypothetical protein